MPTVGALIVELRANSAQFAAEMDNARKGLGATGNAAHGSSQQLARFGAIAVQQVIPGLDGSRVALEGVIKAGINAQGALAQVARGGLLVATALGGYALGNALQNFRELRKEGHGFVEALQLAIGYTKSFTERMKEAADEERAFVDQLGTAQSERMSLAKRAIQADADIATAGRQLSGDELGAASATMEGKLALLDVERKESIKKYLEMARDGKITADAKRELILGVERNVVRERNVIYMKGSQDLQKIEEATAQKQLQKWQDQTAFFIDQLKSRVTARQQFEAALGQGGVGGDSAASGFAAVRDFRAQIEKEAKDLAFLQREHEEGREGTSPRDAVQAREDIRQRALAQADALRQKFGGFPAVLEAIDRAVASVDFGNFGKEMAKARAEIDRTVPTAKMLEDGLGAVAAQFAKIPPGADLASKAIRDFAAAFNELQGQVYGAIGAIAAYEQQVTGAGSRAALPNTGAQSFSDNETGVQ